MVNTDDGHTAPRIIGGARARLGLGIFDSETFKLHAGNYKDVVKHRSPQFLTVLLAASL